MLQVRYSHQIALLADDLAHHLQRQPQASSASDFRAGLLQPQPIIVQSNGLAQWLRMHIARSQGICANIEFPFVSSFLWALLRRSPQVNIPKVTPFDKPVLIWRLLSLFERPEVKEDMPALARYLAKQSDEARYHFAFQLADAYDQYQLYRQDWIQEWSRSDFESNQAFTQLANRDPLTASQSGNQSNNQQWQAALWHRLVVALADSDSDHKHIVKNRTQWLLRLPDELPAIKAAGELPSSIYLFGINSMPPLIMDLYANLAEHTEVTLFLFNPSNEYWGDHRSVQEIQAAKARQSTLTTDQTQPTQTELFGFSEAEDTLDEQDSAVNKDPHALDFSKLDDADALIESQNPLLASMGRMGREFIDLLLQRHADMIDVADEIAAFDALSHEHIHESSDFYEDSQTSMLRCLQTQIQQALPPSDLPFEADASTLAADASIQICSHYRPMREVQGLHDYILHWLDSGDYQPKDILVLTSDIEKYAPLVKQYFDEAVPAIPYSVTDRAFSAEQHARQLIFQVLDLLRSRITISDMLSLLNLPTVAQKFRFDSEEIQQIRAMLNHIGIRWGLNLTHRQRFGSQDSANTWTSGLANTMQLAVFDEATLLDVGAQTHGILFADHNSALLAKFWPFYQQIEQFAMFAFGKHPMQAWLDQISQLLSGLLPAYDEGRDIQAAGNEVIASLYDISSTIKAAEQLSYQSNVSASSHSTAADALSLEMFDAFLDSQWPDNEGKQGFLSGGVTVASMVPMRAIPCKIIAFLGLDDGLFPRQHISSDLDLMQMQHLPGDRNRRLDDRYLFLEALLSAQEKIYLSYNGTDPIRNQAKPPSPLISELYSVMAQSAGVDVSTIQTHYCQKDTLQAFSPSRYQGAYLRYQDKYRRMAAALLGMTDQANHTRNPADSHEQRQSQSVTDIATAQAHKVEQADSPTGLSLKTLQAFWHHPIKHWMQKQANIKPPAMAGVLSEEAFFEADGLDQYRIRELCAEVIARQSNSLKSIALNERLAGIKAILHHSQLLPPGRLGEHSWSLFAPQFESLLTEIDALPELAHCYRQFMYELPSGERFELSAEFTAEKNSGDVLMIDVIKADDKAKYDIRSVVRAGLAHIMICLHASIHDQPMPTTKLMCFRFDSKAKDQSAGKVSQSSQTIEFAPIPAQRAKQLMNLYLQGYLTGQQQLIEWLPKITLAAQETARADMSVITRLAGKWPYYYAYDQSLQLLYPAGEPEDYQPWADNYTRYMLPLLQLAGLAKDSKQTEAESVN